MSGSVPQSHTSTQQWQSFELRMRQRRVDRCLQRARTALAAGRIAEAGAAIEEARVLDPRNADATALAARVPLVAARFRARQVLVRRVAGLAAVVMLAVTAAAGWVAMRSPAPPETAQAVASSADVMPFADPVAALTSTNAAEVAAETSGLEAPDTASAAADGASAPDQPATPPEAPVRAAPPSTRVAEPSRPAGTAGVVRTQPEPARGYAPTRAERETPSAAAGSTPGPAPQPPVTRPAPPAPQIQSEPLDAPVVVPELPAVALDLASAGARAEPLPAISAPAPAPARDAPAPAVNHEVRVRAVLNRYQAAYNALDASAAGGVWPTVDTRALARAFDGLTAQTVSLGTCDVQVRGAAATAACRGQARWTPRVGGGTQSASRSWRFELAQKGDDWVITNATVR